VIGKIGVEKRRPRPPGKQPPRRWHRRLSGLACSAFFLAGVLGGASVGLLFLGRRISRQERPATSPQPPSPQAAAQPEEIVPPGPTVVIGPTATRPARTPDAMEAGATEVYCFFDSPDHPPTAQVTVRWLRGANAPAEATAKAVNEESDHLRGYLALPPPQGARGFPEGIYEVQVLVDGVPLTDASFAMVKSAARLTNTPKGMERYRPALADLVVSTGAIRGAPKKPFVLPAKPNRVQASFKYSHAVPGTAFTVNWLYEDGLIAQAVTEIDIRQESGKAEAWLSPKPGQVLPNGKYGVEIGTTEATPPLARTDFWIGRRPRADELKAKH
jgi:hypothetical protein